jgi:EAL and modified HD-GYP domain-containing signal transduction protein
MEKEIFIGRQPILNADNELFAYELLYRDIEGDNLIPDNRSATASVLVHTLNQFGLKQLLGRFPAFIKVDSAFLMQDMIYTIPREQFVLSLFDTTVPSGAVLERIAHFRRKGYRFAINDTVLDPALPVNLKPLLPYLSFCKVDTRLSDIESPESIGLLRQFNALGIQCIATKVETHKMFHTCRDAGFSYFQGYYFSRPKLLSGRVHSVEQAIVMKLWRLIVADAPIREIAAAFEETPILSAQLLRYINSAAFHFKAPIKSIQQILTLLGRMALMQWLLLSINAKHMASPAQQMPLQILLLNRIEVMQRLFQLIRHKGLIDKQEVHFVGLLSFIDILLGVPLSSLLEELDFDAVITDALLEQKGLLGDLLKATRAIEHFDMNALEQFLKTYDIAVDNVISLTMQSIEKINAYEAQL